MLLRNGSSGSDVLYLQYGLHIMCFGVGGFDSNFGQQTHIAVTQFQGTYGLAVDGIVGDGTWNKLTSLISPIQSKLNDKGFNCGVVDGVAGPKTYNQVLAFQRANGLVADGMVGPATRGYLFSTGGAQTPPPTHSTPPPSTGGLPSSNKKVLIDPGHGGYDPGAVGNGINEKDIVLSISKKVGDILKSKGCSVSYSRTSDVFIGLDERAAIANNIGVDFFVSIHCNSASPQATGTECFTHPTGNSKVKNLSVNIAAAIASKFGIPNRGHKEANFAVLRRTNMSAILVETAFISNYNDAQLLKNSQDDFAMIIATEILKYL